MNTDNLSILNRISILLKEQGKTQKALCTYIGLKQQAFTNWKNNDNDSYLKYLPEIADFFGVSVDYLLGKPIDREKSHIPSLLLDTIASFSQEEMKELENYIQFMLSKRQ